MAVVTLAALPLLCCIGNGCCGGWHVFARVIAEVICPTFCCFQTCMCRPNTRRPYEKGTKLYPIFLWLAFSFGCFVTAIYGTAGGTGQFQNTFVRGSCLVDNTRVKITTFIDQFKEPVIGFKDTFGGISDYVSLTVGSTDQISTAINALVQSYQDISDTADTSTNTYTSTYPNEIDPNRPNRFGCEEPLAVVKKLTQEASDKASLAGTGFKSTMTDIGTGVEETLVGLKVDITKTINSASTLIDQMRTQVDETMKSASAIVLTQANQLESNPDIMSSVSFSAFNWIYFCTFAFVVGFVLILLNSHKHVVEKGHIHSNPLLEGNILDVGHVGACGARCGAISWCCVFLFGAVASGLGAAFYPISKVYGDVCVVIEDLPLKLGGMMKNMNSRRALGDTTFEAAHWDLFDKINHFTPQFAGYSSVNSGGRRLLDGEEQKFDVDSILKTCWDDGSIYDAMDLGKSIPINASKMFSGFGGVPEDGGLGPESKNALDALDAEIEKLEYCTAARIALRNKIAIVKVKTDELQAEIKAYKLVLSTIQTVAVDKLEEQLNKIKCIKCGFIKSVWVNTYDVVCNQAYAAIVIFSESMVAIGFLAFFVAFLQLLILRRWGGHGPIKAHEHGDDGIQLKLTQKLEGICGCVAHHRKKDEPAAPVQTYEMADQTTSSNYIEDDSQQGFYNPQQVDGEVQGELI